MSDDENSNARMDLESNLMAEDELESVDFGENPLAGDDGSGGSSGSSSTADPTATTGSPTVETTTTPVLGLQPVGSERSHEQYVSLDISRDSDEDKKKSVYHKTTKVRRGEDLRVFSQQKHSY